MSLGYDQSSTWEQHHLPGKRIKLQQDLHAGCDQLLDLIMRHLVSKGATSEDCQQMRLLNRLQSLRHAINGIEESDLKPNDNGRAV